ncbi:hypothetical protein VZC37_13465 [Gordonia sp. LSe1-13]|uniref:Glycosyltransferase family 1 protein n=1 Tax=Gordonia sesuvii TaxID=3116777 RepID=A0ABU7MEP0_9ACTN|nr:hypothetical protein [Gordonia sp. LSe1-13]
MVIVSASLRNPLAEAWRRSFEVAGFETIGVLSSGTPSPCDSRWTSWRGLLERVEVGRISCIIFWWGTQYFAAQTIPPELSKIRKVLVVDTYPNASVLSTEIREQYYLMLARRRADCFVVYGDHMHTAIETAPRVKRLPDIVALMQPYPLATHSASTGSPKLRDTNSVIFTGRSDLLFSDNPRMRKDRMGPFLESLLDLGFSVTVSDTGNPSENASLSRRGLSLYSRMTNSDVLDGKLSEVIDNYAIHLAGYNVNNRTIERRVKNGLSSRFSLGICARTCQAVPKEAKSAVEFVQQHGIGFAYASPSDFVRTIEFLKGCLDNWDSSHHKWSAEAQVDSLRRIAYGPDSA